MSTGKVTNATHGQLAGIRRERLQARQVAIYRITKAGVPAKKPSLFTYPDAAARRIADMERMNPGSRYVTR